ncbi:MAG: DegT/DnrJ/EryC1/StrS family aminotransferase [Candidatus Firestonebacteria bacterium]|nr:DegT/DnrJ/EryC1/StrS family aminotransferase [Candidatus Firestonebacteria bacterium]
MRKIPVSEPFLGGNELKYVTDCIKTNWISSIGTYVTKFEDMFKKFCGTKYALATSNGTVALHLAIEVLGIKSGDEVLVPDLTFVATANIVTYAKAKPVFVDIDPVTWTIDIKDMEKKITKNTKAVIPVHLYGHPANMKEIVVLCRKYNLKIIEDAAESHGALFNGKCVGSFGDFGAFSFYGNKIITTGEGGMLVTNSNKLYQEAKLLRNHGMSEKKKYWHPRIGYNYRMTNIQAAIGVAQMENINKIISRKRKIASLYNKLLKDIQGITTPAEASWAFNVYWMYSILVNKEYGMNSVQLQKKLDLSGIETRPFFYPLHNMPSYETREKFPVTERISSQGINLPSSPLLKDEEIEYITDVIRKNYE